MHDMLNESKALRYQSGNENGDKCYIIHTHTMDDLCGATNKKKNSEEHENSDSRPLLIDVIAITIHKSKPMRFGPYRDSEQNRSGKRKLSILWAIDLIKNGTLSNPNKTFSYIVSSNSLRS